MSGKIIKKVSKILFYVLVILVSLPVSAYLVMQSPSAQTWLSQRVAKYFSQRWGVQISISGVDIELFRKVVFENVYIEDLHRDTLLYAEKIKLNIAKFDQDNHIILVKDFTLQDATLELQHYKGEDGLNFRFLLDKFKSRDTTSSKGKSVWEFGIVGVILNNIHFIYRDERDTIKTKCINFSDVNVKSCYGKITDIKFDADTIHCDVVDLSLFEKSGFFLKKFSGISTISPVLLDVDSLKILTNNSKIEGNITFRYNRYGDLADFIDSVRMKGEFKPSVVEMGDIAYFTDDLYGIQKRIYFYGAGSGTVSDLRGKNISVNINNETYYSGDFSMTGIPNMDQTYMSFDAKELRTSKAGIENIPLPPFHEKHFLSIPENIALFGLIKFKGNFSGFYNDFVAYGKFNTALGRISTDISLKQDSLNDLPVYHGKFACSDFNLGKFFYNEKYLGNISFSANVDGSGLRKENANAITTGTVSRFQVNGYDYKNIDVKGHLAKNIFDGSILVRDENLDMDFNGNVDFSKSPTQMNFNSTITKATLSKLNLLNPNKYSGVTAKINMNMYGNTMDDIAGNIQLSDVIYKNNQEVFDFDDLLLSIKDTSGIKSVNLTSLMVDASISGQFIPSEMDDCLNNFLAEYFPETIKRESITPKEHKQMDHIQHYTYNVQFKKIDLLTRAFYPMLTIAPSSNCSGQFDERKNDFVFNASFPFIEYQGYKFRNGSFTAKSSPKDIEFNSKFDRVNLTDSLWVENVKLNTVSLNDSTRFDLYWKNKSEQINEGHIPGVLAFAKHPQVRIKLLPVSVTVADSIWKNDPENEVVIDSSLIKFSNVNFISRNQIIMLDGIVSKVKDDQLHLVLTNFSLENFNPLLQGSGFSLSGNITGNTTVSNMYDKLILESSTNISNLKVNNENIGNGTLKSTYDSKSEVVNFNGNFLNENTNDLKFSGNYYTQKKENSLEINAALQDFNLSFFEPFVKDIFSHIRGVATAKLKIRGTPQTPLLSGLIQTKVDNVYVNYLGTDYHFDGDVVASPSSFDFSNVNIYDVNGNMADIVNGKIYHDNFRNFQLDVDLNANKVLCLNTTEKDNSVYYGKCFGSGIINIYGFFDNLNLSATMKTERVKNAAGKIEYSQLFIPITDNENINENGFISFVKADAPKSVKQSKYKVNTTGFTMDFNLEATPDAQMQLIFDEKVGDIIKGTGKGDIRMTINEFGDFKMYGDYTVESGDYLFTLKNVVNKKFKLENGGSIRWSGNPLDADVNMTATYELRTSLTPLFLPYEQTDLTNRRYPVQCQMKLTGKILQPDVGFDINLPTVDDFTRQKAYDKFKNTENGMNQQVFSLLFTNSFVSPPDVVAGQKGQETSTASSGSSAGTITSTEVLSNQLSNWLSQISKEFDVGVHYRPGDVLNKDQVELALSTQLFNDKVTIDGSVANNTIVNTAANQNAASVVGDINIDYKLTDDGKFRAKAFNKANEGDVLNLQKGPYTQGVGVFYREEFETWKELYLNFMHRFKKSDKKKT